MAKPRRRFDEGTGKLLPCTVMIPPKLAKFIYRERLLRNFADETELLHHIVRVWSETLEPVNEKELLRLLREEAEGQGADSDEESKAG